MGGLVVFSDSASFLGTHAILDQWSKWWKLNQIFHGSCNNLQDSLCYRHRHQLNRSGVSFWVGFNMFCPLGFNGRGGTLQLDPDDAHDAGTFRLRLYGRQWSYLRKYFRLFCYFQVANWCNRRNQVFDLTMDAVVSRRRLSLGGDTDRYETNMNEVN